MIHLVQSINAHLYTDALKQMFVQRANVFKEKLGWSVDVDENGEERDRYDTTDAAYLLHIDEETREVLGSLRLLSTMGPTLLRDVFSDTLPSDFDFESPRIWECTRFCVDETVFEGRDDDLTTARIASELLFAIGEVGIKSGVETVVGNFAPPMLRIYKRAGCELDVLGKSDAYSVPVYLGAFEVAEHVLDAMRVKLGIEGTLLSKGRTATFVQREKLAA